MARIHRIRSIALILAALVMPCAADTVKTEENPEQREARTQFIIGKVSANVRKHQRALKPMAKYLAENMTDLGIKSGKVIIAKDNAEMIRYLREGKVDLVTETPFSAMIYTQQAPAEAIARKWKKGVPTYYSIIFVRKDSNINSLDDLKGKSLAFEDPGSTSGYMLPAAALLRQGYSLVKKESENFVVPENMIGFTFSGTEQRISKLVFQGITEAGAISNLDWDKPDHIPVAHKRQYKIIYRSNPIPRAIEVLRSTLDPKIKERVKALLLDAHNDPNAQHALKRYQKTKRFDALDEETLTKLEEIKRLTPFFSPT